MNSNATTDSGRAIPTGLEESWQVVVGAGAVLALLGALAVAFPFVTGVSISVLLGALLVVGGLLHAANAFAAFERGWKGFLWQSLLAVVYAFAGISLLANPVLGLASLTILLVAYLLIDGVLEVGMGLHVRKHENWGWLLVSGLVSLALAGLLWIGFPATAVWAVGLLVGVSLLFSGVSLVMYGMGARRATGAEAPRSSSRPGGA